MIKQTTLVLLTLFLLLLAQPMTAAVAPGPLVYFTDNAASTGTSPDITIMEQALLDQLNAATASIDVAIYDFNRDSIRDALADMRLVIDSLDPASGDLNTLLGAMRRRLEPVLAARGMRFVTQNEFICDLASERELISPKTTTPTASKNPSVKPQYDGCCVGWRAVTSQLPNRK